MAQKNALLEQLKRTQQTKAAQAVTLPSDAEGKPRQASRVGKAQIGVWLDPAYKSSLLQIRAQDSLKTQESLIAEALNDLFEKYHVPTIRD
jgi:hypothetical protein